MGASIFDLGAVLNAGTVGAAGTLTIGGLLTTNTYSTLSFDLNTANTVGSGVNDLISAALAPVINGNTQIVINTLGTLTVGAYTLINGYSGSIANPGNFTLAAFTGVDTTHGGILLNNNGSLQLFVTNATPTNAYWSGVVDGNWNSFDLGTAATNWRTDATSNTDTFALPGSTTNVHFYTTTPAAGNITTTLGSSFAINTLTFDAAATSAVTINGGTLTIDPSSSSTGTRGSPRAPTDRSGSGGIFNGRSAARACSVPSAWRCCASSGCGTACAWRLCAPTIRPQPVRWRPAPKASASPGCSNAQTSSQPISRRAPRADRIRRPRRCRPSPSPSCWSATATRRRGWPANGIA